MLLVLSVTFVIGVVLIFSAPSMGSNVGDRTIRNNGGHMDTNQFERVVDATVSSYQMAGPVISLVSGLGIISSGYALYKEI